LSWSPRQLAFVPVAAVLLGGAAACDGGLSSGATGGLSVEVAPLSLAGLTDASYRLTVTNGAGDEVWTRVIGSQRFGDGAGSASYVGTCDAASNPNTVSLAVVGLSDADGALTPGADFANPAPDDDPLTVEVACVADVDVAVTFELTIARAARQGFFDVAISFDDIFCSAKLDCLDDSEPLELLFDPLTGEREQTAVMGFACTAGPEQDTHLWMDQIQVVCDGGAPIVVDPAEGPGNLDPPYPGPAPNTVDLLFQAATYRGVEQLDDDTDWAKAYWNVALGLNRAALTSRGGTLSACRLQAAATASSTAFVDGQTPAGTRWPMVTWDVDLTTSGVVSCASHQLDDGTGVATTYTATEGHGFAASYRAATGVVSRIRGTPTLDSLLDCEPAVTGEHVDCTLYPMSAPGTPVQVDPALVGLTATPGSVGLVVAPAGASYVSQLSLSFTAPADPGAVFVAFVYEGLPIRTFEIPVTAPPPDATSTLACANAELYGGGQTVCTYSPRHQGEPTTVFAADTVVTATPDGAVSGLTPSVGQALSFVFTAPATVGDKTISVAGGPSAVVSVITLSDVEGLTLPSAPTIIDAYAQDQQIYLRYAPPSDSGGSSNLVYTATCASIDGPPASSTGSASSAALDVVVPGLVNGLGYTCVVHASNELGAGPDSAPTLVLVPAPILAQAATVVASPVSFRDGNDHDAASGLTLAAGVSLPLASFGDRYGAALAAVGDTRVAVPRAVWSPNDGQQASDGGPIHLAAGVALPVAAFSQRFAAELAPLGDTRIAAPVTLWEANDAEQRAGAYIQRAVAVTARAAVHHDRYAAPVIARATVAAWPVTSLSRPYVVTVGPPSLAQSASPQELTLTGLGFTHVDRVELYDPTSTLAVIVTDPADLAVAPGGESMTVTAVIDGASVVGTWTVAVHTAAGATSPTAGPPAGATWDNSFVVTTP